MSHFCCSSSNILKSVIETSKPPIELGFLSLKNSIFTSSTVVSEKGALEDKDNTKGLILDSDIRIHLDISNNTRIVSPSTKELYTMIAKSTQLLSDVKDIFIDISNNFQNHLTFSLNNNSCIFSELTGNSIHGNSNQESDLIGTRHDMISVSSKELNWNDNIFTDTDTDMDNDNTISKTEDILSNSQHILHVKEEFLQNK